MFKKNSKYRFPYMILTSVVFLTGSVHNFFRFYKEKDGMSMIGGMVFGVLALVYTYDLYEHLKNKKRINS